MKKYLFLFCALITLSFAYGQTTNKNLLYGHWKTYYLSNSGITVDCNNLPYSQQQAFKVALAKKPSHLLDPKDSANIIHQITLASKEIDSSYLEINKDGKFYSVIYFAEGKIKPLKENSTYKWEGDNKLMVTNEAGDVNIMSIKTLTKNDLKIVVNEDKGTENSFTLKLKKE